MFHPAQIGLIECEQGAAFRRISSYPEQNLRRLPEFHPNAPSSCRRSRGDFFVAWGMHIRLAERGDIPKLIPLFNEVDRLHAEWYPDRFRRLPRGRNAHSVTEFFRNKAWQIWVATEPGEVWGMLLLEYRERTGVVAQPEVYALIDVIVVAAEKRGQGIGGALVAHAEQVAREQGARRLELKVYEANAAARSWYEKQGFGTVIRTLARTISPEEKDTPQ